MSTLAHDEPELLLRGMGGFRIRIGAIAKHRASVTILDGQNREVAVLQVVLRKPESYYDESRSDEKIPAMLRYPGKANHPAGDLAPVSWFNDAGRGLLRMLSKHRLIILPLLGRLLSPHTPTSSIKGTRGPSRASELWLTIGAWCLPGGFTIPELIDTTGLASYTVRLWVKHMETVGLVAADPVLSAIGNTRRLVFPAERRTALSGLVVDRWREWRSATGHASLRPTYRHFVAKEPWKALRKSLRSTTPVCFPSGITVLEGGPGVGARSWLMPQSAENGIEVFLYTAERDLDSLIKSLDLTLIQDPHIARIPISTICVLPDQHPAIRLYERRQNSGLYPSGWPWGLAALDAIDHADARVRQAAEDAWRDWLDSQDMEATKARTRNG